MQARLACLLLLTSTCGLCSDVSREQRALEEQLLRGLLAAQMKQKPSAPYWPTLLTLCASLSNRRHDASSNREEEEEEEVEAVEAEGGMRGLMEENLQLLEEVYKLQSLQHLCGALQGWRERQLLQESLESLEENADHPLKRKSPYILKRQTGRSSKSRRPYILKRRAVY